LLGHSSLDLAPPLAGPFIGWWSARPRFVRSGTTNKKKRSWFSAVPNRPFLAATTFPDLARLRDNWTSIRDEAVALHDQGRIKVDSCHTAHAQWPLDIAN